MKEFERKPDGGLSAWIETYEAIGGGENDAEMLCLLLELRRRRENQAEAERERDELRKTLQATQGGATEAIKNVMRLQEEISRLDKESQRLSDQLGACDRQRLDWLKRALTAEAEIARRDAAAGEPVGLIRENPDDIGLMAEFEVMPPAGTKLYTAAPPAVLPPEWSDVPGSLAGDLSDAEKNAWLSGANDMRGRLLSLGAQQQKVVELQPAWWVMSGKEQILAYPKDAIFAALDADNVKWEVKK